MKPITLIDFPLDVERALTCADYFYPNAPAYYDKTGVTIPYWLKQKFKNSFTEDLITKLGFPDASVRFYWQLPNTSLPVHRDNDAVTGINFILSENPAPITFSGIDYFYKQAIVDISQPHSVTTGDVQRLILKVSLQEEYSAVVEKMKRWVIDSL